MRKTVSKLSILVIVLFVLVSLPLMAVAETEGDFTYWVNWRNEATVTGYIGAGGDVVIPDTLGGASVTAIGGSAFAGCSSITSIKIPETVKEISSYAFQKCSGLASINIPYGVTYIAYSMFEGCASLTSITLPDSVTSIRDYAFSGCSSLTSITLPDSVTSIGNCAFSRCSSLTSITLPDSISQIGQSTFTGCSSLTSITLPDSVTSIGNYAFSGCSSLSTVTVPDSITSIGIHVFSLNTIIKFGTNSVIEQYCQENFSQYICDKGSFLKEEFATVDEKIAWVINRYIKPGMSEYTKALTLYDWLCANVVYDYAYLETDVPTSEHGVGGEGALLGGVAVCQGYAEAYLWLMKAAGMEAVLVDGDNHAWNLAKIDGKWYQFDATWDDTGGGSTHDFFGLSNEAMKPGHPTQYSHLHIVCDSYEANYFYRQGAYNEIVALLQESILTNLSQGIYSGTVRGDYYNDRGSGYTIALIVEKKTEWPLAGYIDITPSGNYNYDFVFYPDETPVTSIDIAGLDMSADMEEFDMYVGYAAQMHVETEPAGIPVTFTSSDESVLTVSQDGVVTAVGTGIASITVSANGYSISFTIRVQKWLLAAGDMYLAPSESRKAELYERGDWFLTDTACTWSSSDTSVVTVDKNGLVTGVAAGTATITLTTAGGASGNTTVYVREPATGLAFTKEVYEVYVGQELYLSSVYFVGGTPDAYNKIHMIDFTSSDRSIAYKNGTYSSNWNKEGGYWEHHPNIVAVAPGEITLTATSNDGSNVSATCIIRVLQAPAISEIVLDASTYNACVGGQVKINFYVVEDHKDFYFENYGDFNYSMTKTGIAKPVKYQKKWDSETGWNYLLYVDALTAGETKLVFQAKDGSGVTAECSIVVSEHAEAVIPAVEASCTAAGLTEGKKCEHCGTILVAQQTVAAQGHSYTESVTTAPTCTENGVKTFACGKCKDSYTEPIAALGHKEVSDAAIAPTCTATGLTEGKHCERCGTVLVAQQTVAALGHKEVIDAAIAPTCTATGLTEGKHCERCGTVLVAQQTVAALGHSYSEKVTTESTCTAEGVKTFTCSKCSHSYTESIAALGHKEVIDAAIAPTCTATGLTEGKHCERCNTVLVAQETVAALGHSYSEQVTTNPTCTETGVKTFTCGKCSDSYTDPIAALGHKEVTDAAIAPTCTATGLTEGKHCERCNTVLVAQETVAALGHQYDNGKVTIEPTYTAEGEKTFTCASCGHSYKEIIPALRHTEETIPAVAATCTMPGLTEGKKCSVCGTILVAQTEIPALGHSYSEQVTTAPTCTETGIKTFTCSKCKDCYTEAIAALGHKEVIDAAIAPTCIATGLTEGKHCERCEAVLVKQNILPATGHTWDEDKYDYDDIEHWVTCPSCGEISKEPHRYSGDSEACEICGYAEHSHDLIWAYDETHCWEVCSACGFVEVKYEHLSDCNEPVCWHCGQEDVTIKYHWHFGGYDYDESGHWTTCPECGEVPKEPHYYIGDSDTCDLCGYVDHDHDLIWAYDETHCWKKCSVCGKEESKNEHSENCTELGKCGYCGQTDVILSEVAHWVNEYEWDESKHWLTCTDCQEVILEEAHFYYCDDAANVCYECGLEGLSVEYIVHENTEIVYDETSCREECLDCGEILSTEELPALPTSTPKPTQTPTPSPAPTGAPVSVVAAPGETIEITVSIIEVQENGTGAGHVYFDATECPVTCTAIKTNNQTSNEQVVASPKGLSGRIAVLGGWDDEQQTLVVQPGIIATLVFRINDEAEPGVYTIRVWGDEDIAKAGGETRLIVSNCDHANIVTDAAVLPACTTPGLSEGSHCADCGAVIKAQEEVAALGHTAGEKTVVTEPTETTPGLARISCVVCGAVLEEEEISAGSATRVAGDANGDDEVDLFDALVILQYDVGWDVEIALSNSDVNGDDTVDLFDALVILQYDVGWDVVLQ